MMSYKILGSRWCDIIVLNVHAPSEDESVDTKDNIYEELKCEFDQFPKYHMRNLLGDLNRRHFQRAVGNELYEICNDKNVRSKVEGLRAGC